MSVFTRTRMVPQTEERAKLPAYFVEHMRAAMLGGIGRVQAVCLIARPVKHRQAVGGAVGIIQPTGRHRRR